MKKFPALIMTLSLMFSLFIGFKSYGAEPDPEDKDIKPYEIYDSRNYMTGDWGGLRPRLNELGITPYARYYITVLGNPVGGKKKGVQYAGLFNVHLNFDLERLLNIPGAEFLISGSWASGRSLSEEDIGNFFTASEVFSGRSVRLFQLILKSEVIEDLLTVAVGRMGIGDQFSTSEIFYNYVSTAINGHPISFPLNDEAFFSNPQASWAARVGLAPAKEFYMKAGVYNSNPRVGEDSAHGVDFSFKKGVILVSEIGYLRGQKAENSNMPGRYTFGAFYDNRKFDELSDDSKKQKGNYGLYWILQQMIYRENAHSDQGLTPWTAITISPDETINTFPIFISGGLVYKGLVPDRGRDVTAFGFAYGTLSDDLENKDYELMLELTHIFQATPWLQIQPDIQWVIHPGGSGEIPNALVIGMQMVVDL